MSRPASWNESKEQAARQEPRRGGPPQMPPRMIGRRNHLWIGSQPTIPRERFSGRSPQGDDEDWPPDAPVAIDDVTSVAKTHGQVAVKNSRGKEIDIHELLKREAFAASSAACDSHFEKNRPCPDEVFGTSDQYVILDSWVKDLGQSIPSRGIISWNFMVQGVSQDQNVGVKDKIDTVVGIQIGSFTIPTAVPGQQMTNPLGGLQFIPGFPLLDKGTEKFDPLTDPSGSTMGYTFGFFPYIGRITIELQEIGLQSISQRSGVRYHFEADVIPVFPTQGTLSTAVGGSSVAAINPQPQALRVVPLPGFDTYIFTEPIKDIHGLTLVFRSIDQIIPFPLDVITGVTAIVTSGTWPYLGLSLPLDKNDYGPTGRWIFNLVGLTRVFISGFQSGNAEIDNWVNQAPGMLSQIPTGAVPGIGINGLDTGSSTTDVNFTITLSPQVKISSFVPVKPVGATVVQIPSKTPITVRFSASRIRIPMRFRRVVQRLTTYGVM